MLTKKELKILKKLQLGDYMRSQDIEKILEVSNKTARKQILLLNDKLLSHGAKIESKPGKGYLLVVNDENLFHQIYTNDEMEVDSETRWEYLAKMFIETEGYLKVEDLMDTLYVSQKVTSYAIKKAEQFFNSYHLQFERKPHYGIRLIGEEYDKRRSLVALAKGNNFLKIDDKLVTIVNYIFIKYEITMSETARESFIIHLQFSINRLMKGKTIELDSSSIEYIHDRFFQELLFIARELSKMLEDEYSIHFSEDEIYSIALHISDKKFYETNTGNVVIDDEVTHLVKDILTSIKNTYRLDFENDLDIFTMLVKHMIPLKIRVSNGSNLKNPLLNDIQDQYPFAMTIAKGINPIIEQYFSKKISEDELSYIAIAIQLAIEKRKKRDRRKKNILIICASGSISSKLFEYRFKEMFKDNIASTQICSYTDLKNYDFTNIDYVFATVPIDIQLPIPVYQMTEQILTPRISIEIQKMLELSTHPLSNKFSPNLFFSHLKVESKEELLKMMCDESRLEKGLSDQFYKLVMKREAMLETSYENLVALPHPYRTISKETFVCTALLDEALIWGKYKVRAVFLIAVSDDRNEDIENFYDDFFDFVLDKDNINQLLNHQSFEYLLYLLNKENV